MGIFRPISWTSCGTLALVLTQIGTGCGRIDGSGDGEVDASGSGGQLPPAGSGGWIVIVEGCESPTYEARSFCYWDCPNYDPERARCDPLCVGYVPPDCPAGTGGVPSDPALDVLAACQLIDPDTSMGGWGGQGAACVPTCGECIESTDCCLDSRIPVCLQGVCVYR